MPNFKTFIQEKIDYVVSHFKIGAILLDFDGTPSTEIDFSFNQLSDQYLNLEEEEQQQPIAEHNQNPIQAMSLNLRITDKQLEPFLNNLNGQWSGKFNISHQNITDQSILRFSSLIKSNNCKFSSFDFSNNKGITFIGGISLADALRNNTTVKRLILKDIKLGSQGVNRIIQLVSINKDIKQYDFGIIGNQSLKYLARQLENPHVLQNISFAQDMNDRWKLDGKKSFDLALRSHHHNKQLTSITIHSDDPEEHHTFLAELSILCLKNRKQKIKQRENDFKSKSLNPEHPKYYDPDNHSLNAYKFSVKSYLTNVFESMLDQGLYFLEKQRRNSLRQEAIFNVTKIPMNKTILEDICTSDGSIMVLAQYLLNKVKP